MDKTIRLWNIETGQEGPSQAIPDILSSGPIPPTSTFTFKSYQQSNGPHTLPRLFGLTSSSHFAPPDFHHCSLLEDGWVSSSGRLLYWVPPHNRYGLQHSHILLIPTTSSQRATWIDFTRFHCGTFWTKCRK
ncbi:hypothetical protein FRB91_007945 [Serendipita sp. 411]|nr:hypothetical protein FRB91_007945 [Serendipita sp. 411]